VKRWYIRFQWRKNGQRFKAVLPLLFNTYDAAHEYMFSYDVFTNLRNHKKLSDSIEGVLLKSLV
jgi:hypothetical protein